MPLINLAIVLLVVGILLWVVNTCIPMDRKIKKHSEYRRGHCGRAMVTAGVRRIGIDGQHTYRPMMASKGHEMHSASNKRRSLVRWLSPSPSCPRCSAYYVVAASCTSKSWRFAHHLDQPFLYPLHPLLIP